MNYILMTNLKIILGTVESWKHEWFMQFLSKLSGGDSWVASVHCDQNTEVTVQDSDWEVIQVT